MSNKFTIGDHVRVTNPLRDEFDRTGVVTGYAEIQCEPASKVMLAGTDLELIFRHTSLTLADPDVHTVLDQMDKESAGGPITPGPSFRQRFTFGMDEREIDGEYVPGKAAAEFGTPFLTAEQWEAAIEPDPVTAPSHYRSHPSGIECLTITRHMGFNLGNAFKYIWRADLKGAAIQDLEKAAFYIADEIAKRKAAL